MKRPGTSFLALGLLLLAALPSCRSNWVGRPLREVPEFVAGQTTRAEVVEALGTPQVVRRRGEASVLTWNIRRVSGTGFGLGSLLIHFGVGKTQANVEKYDVAFGADGKVVWVRRGGVTAFDTPGPWPFGDARPEEADAHDGDDAGEAEAGS